MTFPRLNACRCFVNLFGAVALLLAAGPALAQDDTVQDGGMFPPMASTEVGDYSISANEPTHPLVRVTTDKSEIIKLNEDATSILIGNPAHLSVLLDTPRTLILVPRAPGATFFTALGDNGRVLMQRHVIVASPKEQYIRVRRSCVNAGQVNCEEVRTYFCPDMCHEIVTPDEGTGAALQNSVSASRSGGSASSGDAGVSSSTSGPAPADDEEKEEKEEKEEAEDDAESKEDR